MLEVPGRMRDAELRPLTGSPSIIAFTKLSMRAESITDCFGVDHIGPSSPISVERH